MSAIRPSLRLSSVTLLLAGCFPALDLKRDLSDSGEGDCAFFTDQDGDGYGDGAQSVLAPCDSPPAGTVADGTDCDDADADISPDATESCNEVDDNCDGQVDEGVGQTVYTDGDGDGYGDPESAFEACSPPAGTVTEGGDCDDADPDTHPGATPACDDVDRNCDGALDSEDADGDGFPGCEDCNDADALSFPGAPERCDDQDNDCDDLIDEDAVDQTTWYFDGDGDGYGDPTVSEAGCDAPADYVDNADDCNDLDPHINPETTWWEDNDGDGYGDPATATQRCLQREGLVANSGDCDDSNIDVSPDAPERCSTSADDDCDGSANDPGAVGCLDFFGDGDADGYGDATHSRCQCTGDASYSTLDSTDCDDSDATIHPGATETWYDGIDGDCDGGSDYDADGDGFDSDGYGGEDCDDSLDTVYPWSHETEVPGDGIDTDCDGLDRCRDLSCDAWPDIIVPGYYEDGVGYDATTYLYLGSSTGIQVSTPISLSGTALWGSSVGDFDGDGYIDIFLASYFDGDVTYQVDSTVHYGSSAGYSDSDSDALPTRGARETCVADFNADGYDDIVVANFTTNTTTATKSFVYYGSSAGLQSSGKSQFDTYGAHGCAFGDLDSDGDLDIVIANAYAYGSGNQIDVDSAIFWNNSGFSNSNKTDLDGTACLDAIVEDLDGDGKLDVVLACRNGATSSDVEAVSRVFWGTSSGVDTSNPDTMTTPHAYRVSSGDFDGDGYTDLAFASYQAWDAGGATLSTYAYYGSAAGYSDSDRDSFTTYRALDVETGDANLDGYDDIIFSIYGDPSTPTWSMDSTLIPGSAAGPATASTVLFPTEAARGATLADLDLDGWPELLFTNFYDTASGGYSVDSVIYPGSASGPTTSGSVGLLGHGVLEPLRVVGAPD